MGHFTEMFLVLYGPYFTKTLIKVYIKKRRRLNVALKPRNSLILNELRGHFPGQTATKVPPFSIILGS